jgi:hypothetical protein
MRSCEVDNKEDLLEVHQSVRNAQKQGAEMHRRDEEVLADPLHPSRSGHDPSTRRLDRVWLST